MTGKLFGNKTAVQTTLAAAGGVCFAASLALGAISGGSLLGAVYFWLSIAGFIWLPGCFWVRVLRLGKLYPQIRAMLVLMLGTGFFAVSYCFAGRFGLVWLLRLLPLCCTGAELFCVLRASVKNGKWPKLSQIPPLLVFLFGFSCLIFGFYISVMNADPTVTGSSYLNQDLLWNVGNAESFKLAFPPQDIRFSLVRLSYHYLTELTVGALSWASGISAYHIFAFYMGPVVLAAMLLCLYQTGMVVYNGSSCKALLFCALSLFGGCAGLWDNFASVSGVFGNTVQIHLLSNINSQTTAVIFISVFVALFTLVARKGFSLSMVEFAVFAASVFLMTFAKGPEAAIVICAFAIVMAIVLVFQKPAHPFKAILLLAVSVGIFAVIYFMVFASGANTSVHWSNNSIHYSVFGEWVGQMPLGSWQRKAALVVAALALTVLFQPLQSVLYLVTLPADVVKVFRLAPERLLARGTVAGGMLAYFILWHESSSQIYFAFAAFYFMNLLAADCLPQLKGKLLRGATAALLCAGLCSSVCLYSGVAARSVERLAYYRGAAPVQGEKYAPASAGDVEAMRWLAQQMQPTDRFATNRIHTAPERTDGISNLYSAFCGHQAYMEGYTYAYTNEGVSAPVIEERQTNNALLFAADSSAEQIRATCAEIGVQWLVYSLPFPGADSQLQSFELVYQNDSVRIYKVS